MKAELLKAAEFRTVTVKVSGVEVTVRELSAHVYKQYRDVSDSDQERAATIVIAWAVVEKGVPVYNEEEATALAQNMRVSNAIVAAAMTLTVKEATAEKQVDAS